MPQLPGPCQWDLPDPAEAEPGQDVVAVGADLEPSTVFAAYCSGMFPMHLVTGELAWWSPDPRGVMPLNGLHVSRSLRRSMRRFTISMDTAFTDVMLGCAENRSDGRWITDDFVETYTQLHDLGWGHSVEVWQDGDLVGGLYGLEIGGLFAGESMFHRVTDASKAALVFLVDRLRRCGGPRVFDVQWRTEHLSTLGVVEIPRAQYLLGLREALTLSHCLGPESN